jgi:hypothetical protein
MAASTFSFCTDAIHSVITAKISGNRLSPRETKLMLLKVHTDKVQSVEEQAAKAFGMDALKAVLAFDKLYGNDATVFLNTN